MAAVHCGRKPPAEPGAARHSKPSRHRNNVVRTPGSAGGSIATVRYPRTIPKDEECARHLKKRTLTNLYNTRPTWLALAHQNLDAAVFAAYGWDPAIPDDDLLAVLLPLNFDRA